jgi:tetratricopeptide (TPR) repeat protein
MNNVRLLLVIFFSPLALSSCGISAASINASGYDIVSQEAVTAGQYQKAVENADKAISLEPKNAYHFYKRAVAKKYLGKLNESLEDCGTAISLGSSNPDVTADAYCLRAQLFGQFKRYDDEVKDLTAAIKLDPHQSIFYSNRAGAFQYLGEPQKSIDDCDKALAIEPKNAHAYRVRSAANRLLGKLAKSMDDSNMAVTLSPQDPQGFVMRAQIYLALNQTQKALDDCNTAIKLDPRNSRAYLCRTQVYDESRNREQAETDRLMAAKFDSGH